MSGREEYLAPSPTSSSSSTRSAHQSPYFDPLETSYRPYESGNTQSWTHERPPQNRLYPQKQPPSPTGSLSMGQMRLPIRPPQRPSLQDRVEAPTVQFILVSQAVLDFLLARKNLFCETQWSRKFVNVNDSFRIPDLPAHARARW